MCCRNLKGFSVFGNGAAGNLYTAESQQVGECLVRIGLGRGRGKTGGGKGVERSNDTECGFECAAVGLGQAFLFAPGFGCGCRQCCRGRFGRYAGRRVWQHIRPIFLSAISTIRSHRRRFMPAGSNFSMRSGLVSALLHPTSTPRAYGPGCLRCCRSGSPARQGNR